MATVDRPCPVDKKVLFDHVIGHAALLIVALRGGIHYLDPARTE